MSDSWVSKDWIHCPERMSHTLAFLSQPCIDKRICNISEMSQGSLTVSCSDSRGGGGALTPDTNVFPVSEGARSRQSTSAACPWKLCSSCPLSTSHNAHVPSPLDVKIFDTSRDWQRRTMAAVKLSKNGLKTAINGPSALCEASCDQDIKPRATGCFLDFLFFWWIFYLHVRVGEATGRQVVCVHGHRLLLGGQVLVLVQGQRVHRAFVVQTPLTEETKQLTAKQKTVRAAFGPPRALNHSPTSYGTARGGVGAGHHPSARHCHSMLLIKIKRGDGPVRWITFIRHN